MNAEELLVSVANEAAVHLGFREDEVMYFTVATPGLWTDRIATEVEHHLVGNDPCAVLLWFDEVVSVTAIESAVAAQVARLR